MSGIVEVLLFTLVLSFVLAVIYRVLTKPEEMRRIKANMKEIQAKIKDAQKSGNMDQVNALTSEMLKGSQQQFSQNMKPMLASMVLFFLLIGWLHGAYGNAEFDNEMSSLSIEGAEGQVFKGTMSFQGIELDYLVANTTVPGESRARVHVVDTDGDGSFSDEKPHVTVYRPGFLLLPPSWEHKGNDFFPAGDSYFNMETNTDYLNQTSAVRYLAKSPIPVPFIGNYLSWFWWYIVITLPATFLFRKMLGVE